MGEVLVGVREGRKTWFLFLGANSIGARGPASPRFFLDTYLARGHSEQCLRVSEIRSKHCIEMRKGVGGKKTPKLFNPTWLEGWSHMGGQVQLPTIEIPTCPEGALLAHGETPVKRQSDGPRLSPLCFRLCLKAH